MTGRPPRSNIWFLANLNPKPEYRVLPSGFFKPSAKISNGASVNETQGERPLTKLVLAISFFAFSILINISNASIGPSPLVKWIKWVERSERLGLEADNSSRVFRRRWEFNRGLSLRGGRIGRVIRPFAVVDLIFCWLGRCHQTPALPERMSWMTVGFQTSPISLESLVRPL